MLIEIRVQLNGTLRQDLDRVAGAIREAKSGLCGSLQNTTVYGPTWERDDLGNVSAVRYRVSDTYPAGYAAIWSRPVTRQMEFTTDAQGSAEAA